MVSNSNAGEGNAPGRGDGSMDSRGKDIRTTMTVTPRKSYREDFEQDWLSRILIGSRMVSPALSNPMRTISASRAS